MTSIRVKPMVDQGSLVAAIKWCTTLGHLKTIQAHMVRTGLTQDTFLTSKLIESSAITFTGRHVDYAHRIFTWTHHPNLFMWNTLIRGYSLSNSPIKSITLYKSMYISPNTFTFAFLLKACCKLLRLYEGKEVHSQILKMGFNFDTPVTNGLLRLYVTCGCIDYDARILFDEMWWYRDAASWTTMVSGYAQNGYASEALALFREMQFEGVEIDGFTLASVVGVCGELGALDLGKWVHSYINKEGVKIDVVLGTSLVDMYSKCGSLDDALSAFNAMNERDVMAWSTMIEGYAIHGYGEKALEVFDSMKRAKVRPNCITFTSILCACSHSGLVDEGCRYFDSMWSDYGIARQIEHYGCMVDLFCRAGLVRRAHEFIQKMPVEPNAVLWRTLLSACKSHGYKQLGEHISRKILELEPCSSQNYVLVSNVYASLGRWSSVSKVRSLMKDKKAKKEHGWSSIEVNFVVHQFVMGDESHPERKVIYQMLDRWLES